jgi:hypothetical protein
MLVIVFGNMIFANALQPLNAKLPMLIIEEFSSNITCVSPVQFSNPKLVMPFTGSPLYIAGIYTIPLVFAVPFDTLYAPPDKAYDKPGVGTKFQMA